MFYANNEDNDPLQKYKINTTRKHWYAFLYAVSLPSDPQKSPKRAFYVTH